jgi:hypothetical protein
LRRCDAREAAREFEDYFVSELVGEFADLLICGCTSIDFADDGFAGGTGDVVEPCLDGNFGSGFGEIAEGDVVSVDLGVGPRGALEFAGLRWGLGWIETRADEIEDSAEGEIVADDLREFLGVGFGIVGARAKVGYREADFVYAEAGACAEPSFLALLCMYGASREAENGYREKPTETIELR